MSKKRHEGWVFIDGSPKWHYVKEDGRSLCRRWLYLGSTEPELGNDDSKDNCKGCGTALAKAKAKILANPHGDTDGGRAVNRWLDEKGYVLCFTLARLRIDWGWPFGWLEYVWAGIWYHYRCPYPIIKDHSARACVEAGNCGCNNGPRIRDGRVGGLDKPEGEAR